MNILDAAAIEEALSDTSGFHALPKLLDMIDSTEELAEVRHYLETNHSEEVDWSVFRSYEEGLVRWPHPTLTTEFRNRFPRVSTLLDAPWKVRVLLRAAEFRAVSADMMAHVFEHIITRHQAGQNEMVFVRYRQEGEQFRALRIVYHRQLEAVAITNLLLPDCKRKRVITEGALVLDWRTEEECKAAGERW